MKHQVQARDVFELVAVVDTQHLRVVARPVQRRVAGDVLAVLEDIAEDASSKNRDLRHQGQGILQSVLPVLRLLQISRPVGLPKLACGLQGQETHGELRHRVGLLWDAVNQLDDVGREHRPLVQLFVQGLNLGIRRNLVCQQQPERCLGEADLAAWRLGQLVHALLERAATVANALHGIQQGGLANQALDATHAADALSDSRVSQGLVSMFLPESDELRGLLVSQRLDL
mmetsp:Transcript_44819/g.104665  ORF Transcript_44819/g.104665 Transcript_44819/m.104665 type:complete len:229 (+) Transcript_44819:804-1490(+)